MSFEPGLKLDVGAPLLQHLRLMILKHSQESNYDAFRNQMNNR